MGVPVIGSDAGGVPEIIEDGKNGLMFETKNSNSLAEKILIFINNKELRRNLAQNAKVYAEETYDYQNHFNLLDNYINNIWKKEYMNKISGTIITLNNETQIETCILSLKSICDEIIVESGGFVHW